MANTYQMFSVRVTAVEQATPQIKRFTLAREDGQPMPAFTGGSHVIVQMPGGFSNAYSLMSDPRELSHYQIGCAWKSSPRAARPSCTSRWRSARR